MTHKCIDIVQNIPDICIASLGLYSHWIRKQHHFISEGTLVISQFKWYGLFNKPFIFHLYTFMPRILQIKFSQPVKSQGTQLEYWESWQWLFLSYRLKTVWPGKDLGENTAHLFYKLGNGDLSELNDFLWPSSQFVVIGPELSVAENRSDNIRFTLIVPHLTWNIN